MNHNLVDKLISYLDKESPYETIVLKGEWGVGKTFLWDNKIQTEIKQKDESRKIYYCSLFGLKNKEDVLTSLIFNTSNIQDAETTLKDIFPGLISATKDIQPVGLVGTSLIGIGKIFQKHVENVKLQNALIVIDDIERKDKNFTDNELMGLINLLKSKNNKILLMLNEDELTRIDSSKNDKNEWQLFKEKVIDIELTLNLTTEDLIHIFKERVKKEELISYEYIFNALRKINITNIRIAQLILNRVTPYTKKMDGILSKELIQRLIQNCVLCYYMYYTNFKNLSPKELLKHIHDYKNYIEKYYQSEKKNSELDKDYQEVYNFLSNNDFYADAEFNEIIVNDLKNGYTLEEIDSYISNAKNMDAKEQNDMELNIFNERLYFDINLSEEMITNQIDIIINKEYGNYNFLFNTWQILLNNNDNNSKKIYDKLTQDALENKININYYSSLPQLSKNIKEFILNIETTIEANQKNSSFFYEKKLFLMIQEIKNQIKIKYNQNILNKYSAEDIKKSLFNSTLEETKEILKFYHDKKNDADYEKFLNAFKIMITNVKSSPNPNNNYKALKRILNLIP